MMSHGDYSLCNWSSITLLLNNGDRTKGVSRLVHKDPARASASPSVLP